MAINIKAQINEFERNKKRLLQNLGNNGVTMFKKNNFEAQGFIDEGVDRWKPKKKADGRKTLVGKTAILRNTISYVVRGGKIEFFSLAPYARVHNEGLKAGRGNGFKMPKRQFMGESKALNKINGREIGLFIKRIFK